MQGDPPVNQRTHNIITIVRKLLLCSVAHHVTASIAKHHHLSTRHILNYTDNLAETITSMIITSSRYAILHRVLNGKSI